MKKTITNSVGWLSLGLAMVLTLAGCGRSVTDVVSQKVGEKVAEQAIENASGGSAKVDIDNGSVKVKTDEGSVESGTNVALPADFPGDVFVVDGKISYAAAVPEQSGFSVMITSEKTVEELLKLYQDKFKADGWMITAAMNLGESNSIVAEKDDRTASVMISKSDDKSGVILSTSKK